MKYLSIPELAKILGVTRITIYRRVKSGQIKAEKIGRNFGIPETEIGNILNETLSQKNRNAIIHGVKKTVDNYGETLKKLGKE